MDALLALGDAGVRTEREMVGQEAEGPLTPWQEVGSRGLDTWFELTARQAMTDGSGGEPGGSYVHSSRVRRRSTRDTMTITTHG